MDLFSYLVTSIIIGFKKMFYCFAPEAQRKLADGETTGICAKSLIAPCRGAGKLEMQQVSGVPSGRNISMLVSGGCTTG